MSTSNVISFRVSTPDYERLQMEGSAKGMTVNAYARSLALGSDRTPSNSVYASSLETRLNVVEDAMTRAGLSDAINQARAELERGGEE